MNNFNLKKKEALKLLNEELKYKLYMMKNIHNVYIYKQVLKELHKYFNEIKFIKLLYSIVMKELKNRDIIYFGKMYKNFILTL
jgi:formylmethanofuran dehydrogenase subunit B